MSQVKNSFKDEKWFLAVHLLHDENFNHGKVNEIIQFNKSDFLIYLKCHLVDSLIIEDWDAALGLSIEYKDKYVLIKPSVRDGKFLFRDNDSIKLIDSNNIQFSLDRLFSQVITDDFKTHPDYLFTGKIVWDEYRMKM